MDCSKSDCSDCDHTKFPVKEMSSRADVSIVFCLLQVLYLCLEQFVFHLGFFLFFLVFFLFQLLVMLTIACIRPDMHCQWVSGVIRGYNLSSDLVTLKGQGHRVKFKVMQKKSL